MNDRHDAGYGDGQYELVGYDTYGQPVYRQVTRPPQPRQHHTPSPRQDHGHDPYAGDAPRQGGPYDPYGGPDTGETARQQPPPQAPPHDGRGTGAHHHPRRPGGHAAPPDPHGRAPAAGRQPGAAGQTAHIPQQAGPVGEPPPRDQGRADRDHPTEQFAFVEEPDGDSEDVIDWLKFTENRTERREEAKRRARARVVALAVVLALVAAGGVGYLWFAGRLPGLTASKDTADTADTAAPAGAQKRDVIVVHLHNTAQGGTSTALLVDNTTTRQGTTVLVPNSLSVSGDDGTATTLAKSVDDDGSAGTRDALDTVLGTEIQGTWRLDTPYLQNLVDLIGNIEVDTDTDVPDPAAGSKGAPPLVREGKARTLGGRTAVAYATYQGPNEDQNAQLQRFGQVMQAVLRKLTSDAQGATTTVQTLGMIIEPPLTDKDLGAFLSRLADLAKGGDYRTAMLPVRADGTLSARDGASVVKNVLGGTAKSPAADAAVRVSVRNASGVGENTGKARVVLLNGGFTFLEGGTAASAAVSEVAYADAAGKADATEVAKTMGLPASAVTKGDVSAGADVSVVLGRDFKPGSS